MSVLSSAPPPADGDVVVNLNGSAPPPPAQSLSNDTPAGPSAVPDGMPVAPVSAPPSRRALIRAALGTAAALAAAALSSALLFALLGIGELRLASPSTGSAGLAAVVMVQLVLVAAAVVAGAKKHLPRSRDLDQALEAEADAEATVRDLAQSVADANAHIETAQILIAAQVHSAAHVVNAIPAHCDATIRAFYEGYLANSEPIESDLYRGYGVVAAPVLDDPVAFVIAGLPPDVLDLPRVDAGPFLAEWARIEQEYSPEPPAGTLAPAASTAPAAPPAPVTADVPDERDQARPRGPQQWAEANARTRPAPAAPGAAARPDGAA